MLMGYKNPEIPFFFNNLIFLDNEMKQFGPSRICPDAMDEQHVFLMRLHLLMVMITARLKGYPTGTFRKKAVLENAAEVHRLVMHTDLSGLGSHTSSHILKERVKLLSIMAMAIISEDYPLGIHRREAVLENIDNLMESVFSKKKCILFHDALNAA